MTARRRTYLSPLTACWLFANLLLGLTILMLGTQAPPSPPAEAVADTTRLRPDTVRSLPETARLSAKEPGTERARAEELPANPANPAKEFPRENQADRDREDRGQADREDQADRGEGEESPGGERSARSRPLPSPCADLVGGVRAEPTTISFRVVPGTGDGALSAQVRQELRKYGERLTGRRVGMVLTFGTGDGAGAGVRLATRVNAALREAYPRVFGTAVTRNFHDLAAPNGSISMEIYFVTRGCSPASTRSTG
ncbi:hypothetical protein [Streptosporangium vulgare]|uniref:Uncharacterized protein n=1 Tax=Streptosporangium vulgare TaxID=46190 RepID=A0ABV5TE94_9ACTN